MVSSERRAASASPDSFRTTRCHRAGSHNTVERHLGHQCRRDVAQRADDDLGEAEHLCAAEQLRDGLLLVPDEGLLEQDALLVPALQAALDDLVQRGARGLPSLRRDLLRGAANSAICSAGTSSRRMYSGRAKAMWTAMSWASTSSAPEISTSTAFTPRPVCRWR